MPSVSPGHAPSHQYRRRGLVRVGPAHDVAHFSVPARGTSQGTKTRPRAARRCRSSICSILGSRPPAHRCRPPERTLVRLHPGRAGPRRSRRCHRIERADPAPAWSGCGRAVVRVRRDPTGAAGGCSPGRPARPRPGRSRPERGRRSRSSRHGAGTAHEHGLPARRRQGPAGRPVGRSADRPDEPAGSTPVGLGTLDDPRGRCLRLGRARSGLVVMVAAPTIPFGRRASVVTVRGGNRSPGRHPGWRSTTRHRRAQMHEQQHSAVRQYCARGATTGSKIGAGESGAGTKEASP
jgi:hypothetical protein